MAKLKKKPDERPEIPIAPMIDAVFLLLIYFMVTSTIEKQEADISFQLPGVVEQMESVEMPDEQIIEINETGAVVVNDFQYDNPSARKYTELTGMLMRFKKTSDANKVEAQVTLAPSDSTSHQIIVRVMDACSKAGIETVNFSLSDDAI